MCLFVNGKETARLLARMKRNKTGTAIFYKTVTESRVSPFRHSYHAGTCYNKGATVSARTRNGAGRLVAKRDAPFSSGSRVDSGIHVCCTREAAKELLHQLSGWQKKYHSLYRIVRVRAHWQELLGADAHHAAFRQVKVLD